MSTRLWFIVHWLAIGAVSSAVALAEHFNENSVALAISSVVASAVFLLYSAALGIGGSASPSSSRQQGTTLPP